MGAPAATGPGVEIVATKLHAPTVNRGLVPRDMLVVRLASGVSGRLVLVSAPAGWGKTVLLAQWRHAEQGHRPFAWVSLDPADDDPVRFWSYVVAALRTVAPGFGGAVLAALPNAGPALDAIVLPRLINQLAELSEPVVLVLDDYHELRDERIHTSVAYLLQHAPPTLQIALATRVDPPLPLARLRAAGDLTEIRAADLQFDAPEAEALLNGARALGLAPADVELLHARTEGWPAGLQLAALSLRGVEDRAAYIRAGGDRQIADYLREVLESVTPRMRDFLLRTSILERMCAPLCAAVVDDDDAAALLAEAHRSNLFLVALDDRAHWYRYHHLLRDLLQRELAERDRALRHDLHARASAWHWRAENIEEAITHAIAAGEVESASDMIAAHWQQVVQGDPAVVDRWLNALGPDVIAADARLCIALGWTSMLTGRFDAVEPLLEAAERNPLRGAAPDALGTLQGKIALTRASLAYMRGNVGRTEAMAAIAAAEEAPAAKLLAGMMLGAARYFAGDRDAALEALESTRLVLQQVPQPQMRLTTLGLLAAARLDAGETGAGTQLVDDAERLIEEHGFAEAPTASLARTAAAMVAETRGDLDEADRLYERAAVLAGRAAWPLDHLHALLAHAALRRRRRDVTGARALAREARTVLAACPDPGAFADRMAALERSLQLAPGAPRDRLAEQLSDRELTVLRLLATDLSQREIGNELFLSLNTVKSHTRTLFRKLGVASRADAVERGRAQGLL
jgi:ATP/maltotriose-dependent transcriptional regulator MalT